MHVLIVDDDSDDRDLISEVISAIDESITLATCCDGREAIEYLQKSVNLPSVVFLDCNMPGMDGQTCLKKIRASASISEVRVVVISTCITPSDAKTIRTYGAEYFVKPDSFSSLEALMRRHLGYADAYVLEKSGYA